MDHATNSSSGREVLSSLRFAALGLSMAVLVGCVHSSSSEQAGATNDPAALATGTAAPVAATAAPAVSAEAASGETGGAATDLPIYPGAVKLKTQAAGAMSECGHKMTLVSYDVAAAGKTVADWYKDHVSNNTTVDLGDPDEKDGSVQIEIFAPNGTSAAVVHQMHFSSGLSAAAKTLGADKTDVGLVTFDPPLGQDVINLTVQATTGDAAARQAAKTKMQAMCPNP